MNNYLAQIDVGSFRIRGTLGDPGLYGSVGSTGGRLAAIISTIIGVMTAIGFIWFVLLLLIGAVQYLLSGGDPKSTEAAVGRIRSALIGLVVLIGAVFFAQLVGTILGIDILNIQTALENLYSTRGSYSGGVTR